LDAEFSKKAGIKVLVDTIHAEVEKLQINAKEIKAKANAAIDQYKT